MEKPIILNIELKKGSRIVGARIQIDAPKISGFLAIECQEVPHATTYIALDNITSFSLIDGEVKNIVRFFPAQAVKARIEQ